MTEAEIVDILREFLWAGVRMGAPIIISALVIGVVIGLFQALTSIQEMTLTFAPKLVVLLIVFWLTGGAMSRILADLFRRSVIPIVSGA